MNSVFYLAYVSRFHVSGRQELRFEELELDWPLGTFFRPEHLHLGLSGLGKRKASRRSDHDELRACSREGLLISSSFSHFMLQEMGVERLELIFTPWLFLLARRLWIKIIDDETQDETRCFIWSYIYFCTYLYYTYYIYIFTLYIVHYIHVFKKWKEAMREHLTWESATFLLNPILLLRSRKTRLGRHWNSRTQREVKWKTCESLQQGQHSTDLVDSTGICR